MRTGLLLLATLFSLCAAFCLAHTESMENSTSSIRFRSHHRLLMAKKKKASTSPKTPAPCTAVPSVVVNPVDLKECKDDSGCASNVSSTSPREERRVETVKESVEKVSLEAPQRDDKKSVVQAATEKKDENVVEELLQSMGKSVVQAAAGNSDKIETNEVLKMTENTNMVEVPLVESLQPDAKNDTKEPIDSKMSKQTSSQKQASDEIEVFHANWEDAFVTSPRSMWAEARRPLYKKLLDALRAQKREVVSRYLMHGNVDVHRKDKFGYSALALAVRMGDSDIIQLILSKLAVHEAGVVDNRAFLMAIFYGASDIVRVFLKQQANVNAVAVLDQIAQPAITIAARLGFSDIVSQLLEAGADINAQTSEGNTALMLSIARGKNQVTDVLLSSSMISLDATNENGESALIIASKLGDLDTIEKLVRLGADINLQDQVATGSDDSDMVFVVSKGSSAVMHAARNGFFDIVSYLIEVGKADISLQNDLGADVFHLAILSGNRDLVVYLNKLKEQVQRSDNSKKVIQGSDFVAAAEIGDVKILKFFARKSPEIVRTHGQAALLEAARKGQLDSMRYLVETLGVRAPLALIPAMIEEHIDCIEYLLSLKDSEYAEQKNQFGKVAQDYAAFSKHSNQLLPLFEKKP